ncbi:MAG: hypothetical protein QME47_04840 [Candidatus Thermoplasmatota archaeon]|nr:hypothetical protein [Candidatus Thermoplasmatota archaeon]
MDIKGFFSRLLSSLFRKRKRAPEQASKEMPEKRFEVPGANKIIPTKAPLVHELRKDVEEKVIEAYEEGAQLQLIKLEPQYEELDIEEEKRLIKELEEKLRHYRMKLRKELELKEKEIAIMREQLVKEEALIRAREERVARAEQELKLKVSEINAKIEELERTKSELGEQIKVLKELETRWDKWREERVELLTRLERGKEEIVIDEDVKKLLAIVDELLGELPPEVVDTFRKSKNYELYEKVMEKYGIG